jgi:ATP-dependent Lhr-like helicase
MEAIGPILDGEDVLLLAPTAGGKTEAAIFPVLSRVAASGWRGVSVLYVCPLKALLNNIEPRLQRYASFAGLRAAVWHGDVGAAARRRILNNPPDLLLTTPESLESMMISTRVDHRTLLGQVRVVVVDELHAFAGDDRGWHLLFLLSRLERLGGRPLQRIGLSATVGNPAALLHWLSVGRGEKVVGAGQPVPDGEVTVDFVGSISNAVTVLSRLFRGERRLIFADSRTRVEEITAGLRAAGIRTFVSHASLSVDERRQAESAFAAEPDCAIVATSTLELGLDVGDLDRVIQVGAPPSVASFLQRMGRSGRRANTKRNLLFLATTDHEFLADLAIATLWRQGFVDPVEPPAIPYHIYAQQIMALILQERGITRPDLDAWIGGIAAIPASMRTAVLQHMLDSDVLVEVEGVIGLGPTGEREFGRRHFSDLVAAFSTPLVLAVQHGAIELGTVHPASLAPRADGSAPVLLLAGRSWTVTAVDWRRRALAVTPATGGGRSRWLGGGRPMPASTCAAAELVIAGMAPSCTLSLRASRRLIEIRDDLSFIDAECLPVVRARDGLTTVWLFGGGLASASVARALSFADYRIVRWDDLSVTVMSSSSEPLTRALRAMPLREAYPTLPEEIRSGLKFGLCLPEVLAREVLKVRTTVTGVISNRISRHMRCVSSAFR